jgi:hypothetical protein
MAADLEALYEHHRSRGCSEEEAARRAEASVLGSSEVIRRLGRLHVRPWRGWAEELSARLSGGAALALLAVGVLPVAAMALGVSGWVLAQAASPIAWAILLVAALLGAATTRNALRIAGDRHLGERSLAAILVLAAMAPALGFLAPTLGLQRVVATLGSSDPAEALLLASLAQDLATLLAGLLVGLGGLLAWFVLLEVEGRRRAREVDALLVEDARPPGVRPADPDADAGVLPLVRRRHG